MNNHHMNPERAAVIDDRMRQAFAFARDVLETPELLGAIPDGATLFFRDVVYRGDQVHLAAHASSERPGWWTARVTGPRSLALKSRQSSPTESPATDAHGGEWSNALIFSETAPTAEGALDALEKKLSDSDPAVRTCHRTAGAQQS